MGIQTRTYKELPICEKEILRYAGCKSSQEELLRLLEECLQEVRSGYKGSVCYKEYPVMIEEGLVKIGENEIFSKDLAKNLEGCKSVILFGATIGVQMDRLIARYSKISPSRAFMMQAIGTQQIEALCDTFCEEMEKEYDTILKPRYSPGYGDVPLEVQKLFFAHLDCAKHIGLSLNDSLLMSPSKSVTAFVGITDLERNSTNQKDRLKRNKCAMCQMMDCQYRGIV